MTWTAVARRDGAVTIGARSVKALLGLVVLAIVLAAYVYPVVGTEPITTARFTGFVSGTLATLLPLVGILLGYNAVVSERESGALLLSLSLPHGRADVILGKLLARVGALSGAVVAAMVLAGFLVVYPFGELEVVRSLAFVGLAVAFGAIWVGLGVAVSMSVATKQRALVLGFGLFFLFVVVWEAIADALRVGLTAAGVVDGELPGPVRFVFGLEPTTAFERITDGFVDPAGAVEGPWYASEWVALAAFAGWLVIPLGLSYLRFAARDLS